MYSSSGLHQYFVANPRIDNTFICPSCYTKCAIYVPLCDEKEFNKSIRSKEPDGYTNYDGLWLNDEKDDIENGFLGDTDFAPAYLSAVADAPETNEDPHSCGFTEALIETIAVTEVFFMD